MEIAAGAVKVSKKNKKVQKKKQAAEKIIS